MSQYHTALVIGRFQPFHYGHLHLFRTAFSVADTITVALGSSNVVNEKNPLSFETRVSMITEVIRQEGWEGRVNALVASPDDPSDEVWLQKLLENAGPFDVAVGNNDWVNGVLSQAGYVTLNLEDLDRDVYQATFIRQAYKEQGDWSSRVPEYVRSLVEPEMAQQL